MADKYNVTFRERRTGKLTTMPIEAVSETNARDIGSFFERSYGTMLNRPVKVEAKA